MAMVCGEPWRVVGDYSLCSQYFRFLMATQTAPISTCLGSSAMANGLKCILLQRSTEIVGWWISHQTQWECGRRSVTPRLQCPSPEYRLPDLWGFGSLVECKEPSVHLKYPTARISVFHSSPRLLDVLRSGYPSWFFLMTPTNNKLLSSNCSFLKVPQHHKIPQFARFHFDLCQFHLRPEVTMLDTPTTQLASPRPFSEKSGETCLASAAVPTCRAVQLQGRCSCEPSRWMLAPAIGSWPAPSSHPLAACTSTFCGRRCSSKRVH